MDEVPMIDILYSCHKCGIKDRLVKIPQRHNDEDIVHWLSEITARIISEDHLHQSPYCHITKIDELKIPMQYNTDLGRKVLK